MIAKYTILVALALIAVILNFKGKSIAKFILKSDDIDENFVFKMKLSALIIAAVDFILVLILL